MKHSASLRLGWRHLVRLGLGMVITLGAGCSASAPPQAVSTARPAAASPAPAPLRSAPERSVGAPLPATPLPAPARAAEAPAPATPRPALADTDTESGEDEPAALPDLVGIASWYGPGFHGKRTASGEIYNQYALTAAHPLLPMGTLVEVQNLENGRKVWVRINDRGPYAKGRILDLSRLAAQHLGIIPGGTAPVRINVIRWPARVQLDQGLKPYGQYVVQVAAYPERAEAEELRESLQRRFAGVPFRLDPASKGFTAVIAGPYDRHNTARRVAGRLRRAGVTNMVRRYRK